MNTQTEEKIATALESQVGLLRAMSERIDGGGRRRRSTAGFRDGAEFMAAVRRAAVERDFDARLAATTWGGSSSNGFTAPDAFLDEVLLPITGDGSLMSAFPVMFMGPNEIAAVAVDETAEWSASGVTADFTDEGAAITPSKPVLRSVRAVTHKIPALVHLTDEITSRSKGVFRYVWAAIGRKLRARVERNLLWGTGLDRPLGVLRAPSAITVPKENAQASSTIVKANVEKMASRLPVGSFPRSIWIAHTTALPQIMDLGTIYSDGETPWGYGKLLGRPVVVTEYSSLLGAVGDLALVDPEANLVAMEGPLNQATIDFAFDQGLQSFRGTVYLGAAPLLSAPISRDAGSDTLGTTVLLEARP